VSARLAVSSRLELNAAAMAATKSLMNADARRVERGRLRPPPLLAELHEDIALEDKAGSHLSFTSLEVLIFSSCLAQGKPLPFSEAEQPKNMFGLQESAKQGELIADWQRSFHYRVDPTSCHLLLLDFRLQIPTDPLSIAGVRRCRWSAWSVLAY
jgi:hypothetical protein